MTINDELVKKVTKAVSVKDLLETQGNQAFFTTSGLNVEIWLQPNISATRFSSEAVIQLSQELKIVKLKQVLQNECTMTI